MTETGRGTTTPTEAVRPEWKEGDLCSWRYRDKKQWHHTHVIRPTNDKHGSIRVWNERTGFGAYVPNVPECIKRRTA